ncbi:MAG: sulfite exporter TauE/SafE family protein [Halopseudomonas aestusnigri]
MQPEAFTIEILLILYFAISIGTAIQISTGIGLGLFSGPALLLYLPPNSAILISICLNILLSIPLAFQEREEILWSILKLLTFGVFIGIPLGWLAIQLLDKEILQLMMAAVILFVAYLLLKLRSSTSARQIKPSQRTTFAGGGVAGFMSGCLAIPGPVAMWTLLQQGYAAQEVRATMRILYIFAYGTAFLFHTALNKNLVSDVHLLGQLFPALLIGGVAGGVAKKYFTENQMQKCLLLLLFLTAFSLILKSTLKGLI